MSNIIINIKKNKVKFLSQDEDLTSLVTLKELETLFKDLKTGRKNEHIVKELTFKQQKELHLFIGSLVILEQDGQIDIY
jgi:glucose/arabinose dehydrogenase